MVFRQNSQRQASGRVQTEPGHGLRKRKKSKIGRKERGEEKKTGGPEGARSQESPQLKWQDYIGSRSWGKGREAPRL